MARMIYPKDSTAMHLRMGRRHVRLCLRVPGAEPFAAAIRPPLEQLAERERDRKAAAEAREEAYDVVILCDTYLDNAVRTTFERTRQFDRDHHTRFLDLLFPARGYSNIVYMPLSKEPQEVNKLLEKMEGIEDGHELKQLTAPLREKMEASTAAWAAYQQTITLLNAIQAREEHERLAVRQQYEHNWLDARKQYGVSMADSIFPKISGKTSAPPQDPEEPPVISEE